MSSFLCITLRFLQPYSHGRGEGGDPEWPPSPLRLLQALVAASGGRWNERRQLVRAAPAIKWLESLPPPRIVAARAVPADKPYRLYVPDNVADKVAASWSRGTHGDIADYRTEKDVRPAFLDGDALHYLYSLPQPDPDGRKHVDTLVLAARSITHLGWGIDMVVGDAWVVTGEQAARLTGDHWEPSAVGGMQLRTPTPGTLDDLTRRHTDFLGRLAEGRFRPVPPLRVFDRVCYRRRGEPINRPFRVFELRNTDGSRFRYHHRRLIHIAGMVRHLAIEAMTKDPPRGADPDWAQTYVAGHCKGAGDTTHRQLSYIPLPSIGTEHTDPGVRRVMIVAPVGDHVWLDHVARRLAGQALEPVRGDEFGGREPPILVPVRRDNVAGFYTEPASVWHTFTPVILPGYDDHKPAKTRALIERALAHSGIEQPCEFEWSAFSRFSKSFSAHKYNKDGKPQGYVRPAYLLDQTAVHLTLRFHDGSDKKDPVEVPGPLAIGAGRHCGFGVFAREPG